ncbi:CsbD family protein [Gracilibacillus kekensis]|uniref:CsbD-like n=1 Tax=Gracilibacillus kekensis TaxID=1027249 RepID=A0A1M7PZZ6_9BACI|nr:CsbD family protein [Gracilibacillus kekensis]SHN23397.1 CsbD-like [Gracilibacillus kekensis]
MSKNNGMSDKIKGAVSKAKGEAKDQIGNATNDPKMQAEGKLDKKKGKVQDNIGESKNKEDEQHRH